MLDPEVIPIPPRLQPVGQGLQNLIDLVLGRMPTSPEEASAFLNQAEHAIYELCAGFIENLPQILRSCGATDLPEQYDGGNITCTDVDGEAVTVKPQPWLVRKRPTTDHITARIVNLCHCWIGTKPADDAPPPLRRDVLAVRRYEPLSAFAIVTLIAMVCGQWYPPSPADAMTDMLAAVNLVYNWCELYVLRLPHLLLAFGGRNVICSDGGVRYRRYYTSEYFSDVSSGLPKATERDAASYECQTPARLLATSVSDYYPTRLRPISYGDDYMSGAVVASIV
jgi:hypothetical protein